MRGHLYDVSHFQKKTIEASGVSFTPHALRRTFSYAAAKIRLGDSERKALLNHLASSDVTDAHYVKRDVLLDCIDGRESFGARMS